MCGKAHAFSWNKNQYCLWTLAMTEHPLQPLHVLRRKLEGFLSIHILSNTLRAQPRWIKIHASQHPASKNRFRSEEWWWRCCKTVGRGKFCVMRLWNACEDCSYHHTLAGVDPSLWARVWCSHQPGGVKEGGGVATDQSASVWTQRFYRRRQQWKKPIINDTKVALRTRNQKSVDLCKRD